MTKLAKHFRWWYLAFSLITIVLGLLSRGDWIPRLIYPYLGDCLYALMVFWIVAALQPKKSTIYWTGLSWLVCLAIELSQLWHPAWLDALRQQKLVALVLGHGFLWSDLVAYAVGVAFGAALATWFKSKTTTINGAKSHFTEKQNQA